MAILQLPKDSLNKSLSDFNHSLLNQIALMEVNASAILSSDGIGKYKCQVSDFVHKGFNRKFILIQELSKEILEAEKRAYGKIIRMMAHEVNNSIGAINSILHTMADFYKEEEESEWSEPLDIAITRNDRMNQFMHNFAKVVRLPEPSLERTEVNQLVSNIGKLMEEQAKAQDIQLVFKINKEPIYAQLDAHLLDQVLVNIIKNSIESIQHSGSIELITSPAPTTIIIRDNGAGITEEAANHIFTPFFSTKKDGQGVGLTLIREILLNHNAQFSLKTLDDNWTEFRIVF
jgi:two-component system nitrogen regulation sensor histidine kinase NtrY